LRRANVFARCPRCARRQRKHAQRRGRWRRAGSTA
jgi:hypothetical protein